MMVGKGLEIRTLRPRCCKNLNLLQIADIYYKRVGTTLDDHSLTACLVQLGGRGVLWPISARQNFYFTGQNFYFTGQNFYFTRLNFYFTGQNSRV